MDLELTNYKDETIVYFFIYSGARKLFRKIVHQNYGLSKFIILRDYCNVRQKISKLRYFGKYLGISFSMQRNSKSFCFRVNCHFIIVIPEKKYLLSFFSQVIVLTVFFKKCFYIQQS